MMQMVHSRFNALLSACVLSLIATAGWSQSITWLGTLPRGNSSAAYAVSADGVVVGMATYYDNISGNYYRRAFRWTASGGMQNLGTLGGTQSEARGVSADGSVVVGWASNAAGLRRAFRWTASGGMQELGTLGGTESMALGVSADGSVVVGWASNAAGLRRAFRWQNGVMQDLGTLGGTQSEALGVSADGAVVVGYAVNAAGQQRAFRWTASGGMQDLRSYDGSVAYGVSADGRVVVGDYYYRGYYYSFRWTAAGGVQELSTLRGYSSSNAYAVAVSDDGPVVVGRAYDNERLPVAFRWTLPRGTEDLTMTYTLWTYPSVLREARAISPDGRYIVGYGVNAATNRSEAFLLDTRPRCAPDGDVNCDGIVDDADLLIVLFNFGNRYR